MKAFGLNELREMFLSFFESKGHLRLPSFSLVPQNDPSLLLINSGMAPLKPYFTGEQIPRAGASPPARSACAPATSTNRYTYRRHGTFFEMLGNFSFGDYFKHEAIAWCWEFLTSPDWVGIDPDRLYPSVFEDDDEAFAIWRDEIGIPPERIFRFGREDNFWEHGEGACGPCSEVYYDRGEKYGCGKPGCTVGCDCDRYIEVWNNVFSQFNSDGKGHYTELAHKNIDTGMGLERLACVCQDVPSLFDVDTVMNITHKVSEITGAHYGESQKADVSLRVITDHIRSATFLIGDGVLPSNEGRGYVLRRLLRRAARHGKLLGVNEPFLYKVCETVIHENRTAYPDLVDKQSFITRVIKTEEESFARTIDGGMRILGEHIAALKAEGKAVLSGADAFRLYDTYGFPLDLTEDILSDEGMTADTGEFDKLMNEQRERARAARGEDKRLERPRPRPRGRAHRLHRLRHADRYRRCRGRHSRRRARGRARRGHRGQHSPRQDALLRRDGRPGRRPRHADRPRRRGVRRRGRPEDQGRQVPAYGQNAPRQPPHGRHGHRRRRRRAPPRHNARALRHAPAPRRAA